MYPTQFNAVTDGDVIHIPEEYKKYLHKNSKVKIFLSTDEPKKKRAITSDMFNSLRFPDDFIFNREEANER